MKMKLFHWVESVLEVLLRKINNTERRKQNTKEIIQFNFMSVFVEVTVALQLQTVERSIKKYFQGSECDKKAAAQLFNFQLILVRELLLLLIITITVTKVIGIKRLTTGDWIWI